MTGRFAIYAAPGIGPGPAAADAGSDTGTDTAAGRLRETAERWLGRSVTGAPVTPGVPDGWTREAVDAITVGTRRYGFHGTLKAPFSLAAGRTPEELDTALARFAASREAVLIPRLRLVGMGDFFALIPGAPAPELYALAGEVVTGFDDFRAPPTEAEIARRHPDTLSPRQRELLDAWGYPYVLDEFRFHLTVADSMPAGQRAAAAAALTDWFAASLGVTVGVDALALFTEAEPGAPFRLQSLHPLRPAAPSRAATHENDSEGAR